MIWFLLFYMWLFIHRPFEVWPALGAMHIELIYVLIITAIWAIATKKQWMPNALHWALFAFAAAMIVCWFLSPWREAGALVVENYLKLLAFYILLVTTVNDEKRLKMLISGFLVAMALYMGHSLWEFHNGRYVYRMSVVRMIGVDTAMGDPNTFACGILYSLPMVLPVWLTRRDKWTRGALVGYVVLAVTCILLTASREAFVGLCFLVCCVVMASKHRFRFILGAAAFCLVSWGLLSASLQTRFESIVLPSVGPANARESAEGRTRGLELGWDLIHSYPVAGVGPGAWRPATGEPIEAHNLYGQLMGEMGTLGVAAFAATLAFFWSNIGAIRAWYRHSPKRGKDFVFYLNRAIGLTVVLLLIEGYFGHNLYRFTWLWYGGFLIIARHTLQPRAGYQSARILYARASGKRLTVKAR